MMMMNNHSDDIGVMVTIKMTGLMAMMLMMNDDDDGYE